MPKYRFSILAIYVSLFILAARAAGVEPIIHHRLALPESYRMGQYYQPDIQPENLNLDGTLRSAHSAEREGFNRTLINTISALMIDNVDVENVNITPDPAATAMMAKASNDDFVLTEEISTAYFGPTPMQDRAVYSYDEFANRIGAEYSSFENNTWNNRWMETRTYNSSNVVEEFIGQSWVNSMWENAQKIQYSYNAEIASLGEYVYVWEGEAWQLSGRTFHSYDANGQKLTTLSQIRSGSNWYDNYEIIMSYDSSGNTIEELWQINYGAGLEDAWKSQFGYDENQNRIEETFLFVADGSWVNGDQIYNAFDAAGNLIETLQYYWENGNWVEGYNAFLSYNEFNDQVDGHGYGWNGSEWVHTTELLFTYDEFQNNIAYELEQNWDGAGWQTVMEYTRTYAPFSPSSLENEYHVAPEAFELKGNYPNPFNPSTSIDFSLSSQAHVELQVVDLKGRTLATLVNGSKAAGQYSVQFDAANYASGVYLYRLVVDNSVQTRKMTLLK